MCERLPRPRRDATLSLGGIRWCYHRLLSFDPSGIGVSVVGAMLMVGRLRSASAAILVFHRSPLLKVAGLVEDGGPGAAVADVLDEARGVDVDGAKRGGEAGDLFVVL